MLLCSAAGDYLFTKQPSLPATPVYQSLPPGLEARAGFLQGGLRNAQQLQAGLLEAPLGDGACAIACLRG